MKPKKIEFTFERTLQASPEAAFAAWLNPKFRGNPWNLGDKLILHPEVDGLFYWKISGMSHYGRFTTVRRGRRLKHTWVSSNTLGEESTVDVTFRKKGAGTVMRLVHSGLPNTEGGRTHQKGWNYFLDAFAPQFRA